MRLAQQYIDPDTGFLMMPGTQRPDGSWRKPRRVKEGYTPQDEVPLYESKGKSIAKARESGYIPGLDPSAFKIDTFVIPTPVHTIPGLNTKPTQPVLSAKAKKKKNKAGTNSSQVKEVTDSLKKTSISESRPTNEAGQPIATDPAKKLRNLKKKLRDIEVLEDKLNSGEIKTPEKEQLDKVARKGEVLQEIKELEQTMKS